mgnify:CR=1 FL=1
MVYKPYSPTKNFHFYEGDVIFCQSELGLMQYLLQANETVT